MAEQLCIYFRVSDFLVNLNSVAVTFAASPSLGVSSAIFLYVGRGEGGVTPPLFFAARAACGQSHTVFVSQHGEAWVCGRNRAGQLGLDPKSTSETPVPVRLPLSETSSGVRNSSWNVSESDMVVQPAAGRAHTMLLLQDGRVLGFGSDEFGVLGRGDATAEVSGGGGDEGGGENREGLPAAPAEEVTTQSWRWQPREIEGLRGRDIAFVSAGGEQSFAISLLVTDAEETGDGSSDGNSGGKVSRAYIHGGCRPKSIVFPMPVLSVALSMS